MWPLPWTLGVKVALAVIVLVASQYHLWSRLSSGSVFSPEFPRALVLLFNWAFGAILLLALMQIALDLAGLIALLLRGGGAIPDSVRYAAAIAAMLLSALGVYQATRVPPLKDVEIAIPGLPPQFDGYRLLQLTDLHISRLFPRDWTQAVVERSNALGVDLIVVTGDLIDGSFDARRADVEPLRDLRARDGVWVIPGNHEYFFGYEDVDAPVCQHGDAGARQRSYGPDPRWRGTGAGRRHRPVGARNPQPGAGSRLPPLRVRRRTYRSCCSTTNRETPRRRPHAAWRCNCPGIPMAA